MHETPRYSSDNDFDPLPLSPEERALRKARERAQQRLDDMEADRDAIRQMPFMERARRIGVRIVLYSEIAQEQDKLDAISAREASLRGRMTPPDSFTLDSLTDE